MELYSKLLLFYVAMACFAAALTYFLSKDSPKIRTLSAILVGATWPMSFPVALLISLI